MEDAIQTYGINSIDDLEAILPELFLAKTFILKT